MDSILQQLYSGEIYPAEQYHPLIKEYAKMRKKHYKHYEDFTQKLKKLEPSLYEKFIQIMDEQIDAVPLELSEIFIDGFRLGARMMIEVFEDKYKLDMEK